ncbi:MAG: 5'/3'-nucleotidase SurE [Phycisphaerae bacterium]
MRILLTNDDGIFAPGLAAIYKKLVNLGEVIVAAPSESRSGMSHSLTFFQPLVCNKVDINGLFTGYSVQGSPADCVKLTVLQLHKDKPIDLVVSGINNGGNAGINIYYSGTVAAAMEGLFLGLPSVALSLAFDDEMNFEQAAEYCYRILKKLMPVRNGAVININIPQLSKGEPKGVKIVPQSGEGVDEYYVETKNETGQPAYQLAGGLHRDEETPNDITSLSEGFIAITALSPGMTDYEKTEELKKFDLSDIVN